jgi:hypothetical protein
LGDYQSIIDEMTTRIGEPITYQYMTHNRPINGRSWLVDSCDFEKDDCWAAHFTNKDDALIFKMLL